MNTRELQWRWQDHTIALAFDEAGSGPLVLLLPALSSISTRAEMHPLMERLAAQFRAIAFDWPGFGTAPRPPVRWTPDALSAFLRDALTTLGTRPHAVVAAGHAATYVLAHAATQTGFAERIALLAPTWRGPLPTVVGAQRPWFDKIRRAVEPGRVAVDVARDHAANYERADIGAIEQGAEQRQLHGAADLAEPGPRCAHHGRQRAAPSRRQERDPRGEARLGRRMGKDIGRCVAGGDNRVRSRPQRRQGVAQKGGERIRGKA